MTTFEITVIVLLTAIVVLLIVLLTTTIKGFHCYRYWLGQHATDLVSMFRPEVTPDECEYFINIKDY